MKKKHPIRITVLVVILVVVVAFGISILVGIAAENRRAKKTNELLSASIRYLTEMDYEAAVATYDQVLLIDDKNVAAYFSLALTYDQLGETELAIQALTEGYQATGNSMLAVMLEDIKAGEKLAGRYDVMEVEEEVTIEKNPFVTLELLGSNFFKWDFSSCAELFGFNFEEYTGRKVSFGVYKGLEVLFDATGEVAELILQNEHCVYRYRLLSDSMLQLFEIECTGDPQNMTTLSEVDFGMEMGSTYDEVLSSIGLTQIEENVYHVSDSNLGRMEYVQFQKDGVTKLYLYLATRQRLGIELSFRENKLVGVMYRCDVPDNLRSKIIGWVGKVIH